MTQQNFARVENGTAREIQTFDGVTVDGATVPGVVPKGDGIPADALAIPLFPDHDNWFPCSADVREGWTTTDGGKTFAAPAPVVAPAQPRAVEVSTLLDALSTSKRAAISQDNRDRLIARGAKGPVAADDPKVVRAAADVAKAVAGFTPAAWFDAALAPAT